MKFPTFAEAEHNDYGRYAIDWDVGERKYKNLKHGIRVYENDAVEISRMGYRDPDFRNTMRREYGLDLVLRSELTNCKFFTPDGQMVRKGWIKEDIFLRDNDRGRIYCNNRYGSAIQLLSPGTQLIPRKKITFRIPNKKREKKRMDRLVDFIALGVTLNALVPDEVIYFSYEIQEKLRSWNIPSRLTGPSDRVFCRNIAAFPESTKKAVKYSAEDVHEHSFLLVKEA